MTKTIRRCAIYTRKSSEEGLEQDYNSLHAQREACEAFIRSQTGRLAAGQDRLRRWRLLGRRRYGAAGLQQRLTHIRQGLVDIVVVYKVDRLTLSNLLRQHGRTVRRQERLLRRRYPTVQHYYLDGPVDPKRAPVIRAIRARSDRRMYPRHAVEAWIDNLPDRRLGGYGAVLVLIVLCFTLQHVLPSAGLDDLNESHEADLNCGCSRLPRIR